MAKKPDTTSPKPNVAVKEQARTLGHTLIWIVLLLVFVGLGGYGTVQFTGTQRSLGTVGRTEIPISRYQRQVRQQIQQIGQQTGLNLDMAQARGFGLDRAALAQLVDQIALEGEAARLGLSVGDAELARRLAQIDAFHNLNGGFDPVIYRDVLARSNIPATEFEAEIRAEAARSLLGAAVTAGVAMPPDLAELMYQWAGERRSFLWAEISQDDLSAPPPEPTPADLDAWYQAHPDSYRLPEIRRITYAWITPEMLADRIEVDEDELRKLYDSRLAQYDRPERRLVERLVFGDEAQAQAAWARLQDGSASFEALVAERGLTLEDVNLDEVSEGELGAAGAAVFALPEPGVAGPLPSALGPAIYRVNAILQAESTPYEAVRDELKTEFALDRARRRIQEMSEEVDDLLAGGATLEDLAAELDLELGHVDWSPEVSEGIAGYSAFRTAAAEAASDDFPEAIGLDDGGLFALRLDQVIPPQVQPFADVAAQVEADWRRDALQGALNALADQLVPRIESGEDPASFGLTVNRIENVTRSAVLGDTPPDLVETAFALDKGKAARIPGIEGTETVALVSPVSVLPPDPEDREMQAAREQFAAQASAALQQDVLGAFTRAVTTDAGVRIDQSILDQVNAQMN